MKDESTIKPIRFKNSFIEEIDRQAKDEGRTWSNMVKTLIKRGQGIKVTYS